MDPKELAVERKQLFNDIYDNKIPKRVPITFSLGSALLADLYNLDRVEAFWKPEICKEALEKFYGQFRADAPMWFPGVYTPYSAQTLASKNRAMSESGYMQHPNTLCMLPEEYDEFIQDPLAFVVEKAFPRIYGYLNPAEYPSRIPFAIHNDNIMGGKIMSKVGPMSAQLNNKFGYSNEREMNVGGFSRVPLDWLADQLRSFDGICVDIRRNKQKVLDAMEAAYPWMYKVGLPADPSCPNRHGALTYQLHMATYLRTKDFEDCWYKPWKRMLNDYASLGMRCGAFLEENWTAKIDYLDDLPTGMAFTWEKGDPQLFKNKLGTKFILGSGFPLRNLTSMTKDEIVDATKKWLDIMMPGGQYSFGFDMNALTGADINMENLEACFNTVIEYGQYGSDAGKSTGMIFNKEDYSSSNPGEVQSRAYITWEKYLELYPHTPECAKAMVMSVENEILAKALIMSC